MIQVKPLKITVLMPVYNAERYLAGSIESILHQTFQDFEFLIIDDGSTDNSTGVIKSYTDQRIRFVQNKKNSGITATLNKGIELASCELIARMDADDISYPERLEKQYKYFQEHPDCVLVSSWVRRFDTKGTTKIIKFKSEYFYYFLIFNTWIKHPTVMYKRSAVIEVGMYTKLYAEDYNLWSKIIRKYKFHNLSEVLLDYRLSDTSVGRIMKKVETEQSHLEQMIENIHYYTGKDFQINLMEVQFLRGTITPLLNTNKRKDIIKCFKKLDYVTACVQKIDNVNKFSNDIITHAALEKKMMLVYKLRNSLSLSKLLVLLYELKYWNLLWILLINQIRKYVPNIKLILKK